MKTVSTQSLFKSDLQEESVFSDFLDKCLYRPLESILSAKAQQINPVSFERTKALSDQYCGIDVVLHEGQWQLNIDEKSQLHNINEHIPTFAFELSYLKNDSVRPGWLIDPTKKTDAYMLCWPYGEADNEQEAVYTGAKALLVSKHTLLDALSKFGYGRQALAERDEAIRKTGKHGSFRCKSPCFWFFYSGQYAEQMINIVVKAPFLEKIAISSLSVQLNPKNNQVKLCGKWVNQSISEVIDISHFS